VVFGSDWRGALTFRALNSINSYNAFSAIYFCGNAAIMEQISQWIWGQAKIALTASVCIDGCNGSISAIFWDIEA